MVATLLVVLGTGQGCDGTDSGERTAETPRDDPAATTSSEAATEDPAPTGPQPCPTQSAPAWTAQDRMTIDVAHGSLGDLVVGPGGRATLAWVSGSRSGRGWQVLTSDLPSAHGDPQLLPGPPPDPLPAGARASALFPDGNHLGVDGAGALTVAFQQDLLLASGQTTENYDLVLSERPAGGTWSPTPHVADEGNLFTMSLAVSSSGAAVAAWGRYDSGQFPSYVTYRPSAGAAWTPPAERIAPRSGPVWDVGIDGSGRAVLLYSAANEDAKVVRGTPTAGWSRPQPLPGTARALAVGVGGAAVVAGTRGTGGRAYTVHMSPSGSWGDPVEQPGVGLYPDRPIAIDGAGRALYVWWEERRLMTRSSGRDGDWRDPCVLADGVPEPRYFDDVDSHVAVNPRGDVVVMWRTKEQAPHLWVRYKPTGADWTAPTRITPDSGRLLGEYRAAIGPRGRAALAWTTGDQREIHVLRTSRSR